MNRMLYNIQIYYWLPTMCTFLILKCWINRISVYLCEKAIYSQPKTNLQNRISRAGNLEIVSHTQGDTPFAGTSVDNYSYCSDPDLRHWLDWSWPLYYPRSCWRFSAKRNCPSLLPTTSRGNHFSFHAFLPLHHRENDRFSASTNHRETSARVHEISGVYTSN